MGPTPKILIADDHVIVRFGIKLLLRELIPSAEIMESGTGDEVVAAIKAETFDLIILDLNMPDTDSFTVVWNILAYKRNAKVLVFSVNPSSLYAKRVLNLGAMGYLQKDATQEEIKRAILTTIGGQVYRIATKAEPAGRNGDAERNPFDKLSDRELQVAKCVLRGYSYAQMERILHMHTSTIATHKFRLYKKLDIDSLAGLVKLAYRHDIKVG